MSDTTKTNSAALSSEEVMRYSRHIIMGQVGSVGQRKLRNAKVLVIGAGNAGQLVIRELQKQPGYTPIGLIDDDPKKRNMRLEGVRHDGVRFGAVHRCEA